MTIPFVRLPNLPIRTVLPDIAAALAINRPVVLLAPPGSGKTTLVPPALMDAPWLAGKRILLLEPRRLAARAAARYMARLLGEDVGHRIGYHIRLERRVSAATRVEILTEGLLTQRLLHDPELSEAGIIIFDEFHERSLAADQGLALALDARRILRPDLRLMLMSATLDPAPIMRHLGNAAVITASARVWPVETHLQKQASIDPLPRQATLAILHALTTDSGSLLVFLPGESEIHRTAELLQAAQLPPHISVHPLFAALPRARQDAAVEPPATGQRKIVLATSIAESSLTIEGVRVVIDTGWMRVPRYAPRTGMSRLETLRVTRDRADQRRGRAGRIEPGICYRLWDETADRQLVPEATPEILDADLAALVLQSADWGASGREDLPWITPPPEAAWLQAVALLQNLNALDSNGRITPRGRRMVRLPIHPRLSHMILTAEEHHGGRHACLLAAAIAEQASEVTLRHITDARRLLDQLLVNAKNTTADNIGNPLDRSVTLPWDSRVRRLASQWGRHLPPLDCETIDTGRLLAWAFPDRIAKRRDANGRYLMVNGHGATLDTSNPLVNEEWLVAIELQDDGANARIRLAAPVERADIENDYASQITNTTIIAWDRRALAVVAVCRHQLGAIILRDSGLKQPDALLLRTALLDGIHQEGVDRLNWTSSARALQARILFLRRTRPEDDWPDVSDTALDADLDAWLGTSIDGLLRWEQAQKINLCEALLAKLGLRHRLLEELAPTHLSVPSGSRIQVNYGQGETPFMAVRIQEVFGLATTPRVAGGRIPVLMHLLSPAQRPVQITADLESFWNSSYARIRKELRGRYPKHCWPEDPRTAIPTRRLKPKNDNNKP